MIHATPPPFAISTPLPICDARRTKEPCAEAYLTWHEERFCGLSEDAAEKRWDIRVTGWSDTPGGGKITLGTIRCENGKLTLLRPESAK